MSRQVRQITCVLLVDGLAITETTNNNSNNPLAISQYFLFPIVFKRWHARFFFKIV